jgi:hypothetical protein
MALLSLAFSKPWKDELDFEEQDYVVVPGSPGLMAFVSAKEELGSSLPCPLVRAIPPKNN